MVWSASTLWAETADGYFRERFLQALAAQGLNSSILSSFSHNNRTVSPHRARSVSPGGDTSFSDNEERPRSKSILETRRERNEEQKRKLLSVLDENDSKHTQRAAAAKAHRIALIRQRRQELEEKTRAVQRTGQHHVDEKIALAQEAMKQRERRFRPVIDQCESQEEIDTLRTASFQTVLCAWLFIQRCRRNVKINHVIRLLSCVLTPLILLRRLHRTALARTYAGMWRGRCHRPAVTTLRSIFPALQTWSNAAIHKLIRKMRPCSFPQNSRIFTDGEPGTAALYISSGRVAVRQKRLHAADLDLGEHSSPFLHGEELLQKDTQMYHFSNLVAVEQTFGWYLPRVAYRTLLGESHSHGDMITATALMTEKDTSKTEVYMSQALENNKMLLSGWIREELFALLEDAEEVVFTRGDVVYQAGVRATCGYMIIRGTLLIAERTRRVTTTQQQQQLQQSHSLDQTTTSMDESCVIPSPVVRGLTDVEGDEFIKEYINAGQMVGVEPLLFSSLRHDCAIAVSDCTTLRFHLKPFLDGMFSDPAQLLLVKEHFNRIRTLRMIPPVLSEVHGRSLVYNPAIASFFTKNMFSVCVSKGGSLPLNSCLIFLQSGSVIFQEKVFKAPCVLLCDGALTTLVKHFESALSNGSLDLIKPDRKALAAAATAAAAAAAAATSHPQGLGGKGTFAGGAAAALKAARRLRQSVSGDSSLGGAQGSPSLHNVEQQQSSAIGTSSSLATATAGAGGGDVSMTASTAEGSTAAPHTTMDGGAGDHHAPHHLPSSGEAVPVAANSPETWGYLPLAGALTLVVKQPFAHDVDPGDGTGRVSFQHLPYEVQMTSLVSDLLKGHVSLHRCQSRVEAWCVRLIDILRRFRGHPTVLSVSKLSDYVTGETLVKLTPPKDD